MKLNKPFVLPAIPGAEATAAEDERHRVLPLQVGEFSAFRGVVGKLVVREDGSRNNVGSHLSTTFPFENNNLNVQRCKHQVRRAVKHQARISTRSMGVSIVAEKPDLAMVLSSVILYPEQLVIWPMVAVSLRTTSSNGLDETTLALRTWNSAVVISLAPVSTVRQPC